MANIVSPADRQTMVSSFLEIAVGQTIDTAHHFLQASKWRIEDALQLFYVGNEGRVATSPSYVPPAKYTATSGDHNLSVLEEDIRTVYDGQGVGDEARPPLPVIRETLCDDASLSGCRIPFEMVDASFASTEMVAPNCISTTSDQFVTRRRRRTRAEINAAANGLTPARPTELVTVRRRRSRSEMAVAASSSIAPPILHDSLPSSRLKRTRLQLDADCYTPSSSKACIVPKGLGCTTTCNKLKVDVEAKKKSMEAEISLFLKSLEERNGQMQASTYAAKKVSCYKSNMQKRSTWISYMLKKIHTEMMVLLSQLPLRLHPHSGKSNILDSIFFVLGITNLQQVRASKLQQFIYKQVQAGIKRATVSFVFDNSDHS